MVRSLCPTPVCHSLIHFYPGTHGDLFESDQPPRVALQVAHATTSDPPETMMPAHRVKPMTTTVLDPVNERELQVNVPHNSSKTCTIGGQTLALSATPGDTTNLSIGKLYDKTKHKEVTPDQLTDFVTYATTNVLRKHLNQVSVSATDDTALEHLSFLQNQLMSL
jgi:hypothetical protein